MVFRVRRPWKRHTLLVFSAIYAATFLLSYGLIAWGLVLLDFHFVSILIFLFFLSLVMFFGIRIRGREREVVVETKKVNIVSVLVDMFTLPFIRVGRELSLAAPRLNVFLFFMDFIVEAPFKMAIELLESWFAFVKEKKEEV
jgi:hypothetical protein